MCRCSFCLTVFVALALVCAAAMAQEKPEEELEPCDIGVSEIVVTASLTEKKKFEEPRCIEVIPAKKLQERAPKSTPDALDEAVGVHVQKTNAGAGAPFIRGLVGPENLILIDGVRYNNSTFRTGPNQYLGLIDPWSIKRLEVLHGPGSVLYGSDAMGGVINILTLDPMVGAERPWRLSGRLMGASAVAGGGGTLQGDYERGDYAGYLGLSHNVFSEVRAAGGEVQPLSDFTRSSIRFKDQYRLADDLVVKGALFSTMIRDAGRVDRINRGRGRFYDNDDIMAYVRIERKPAAGWLRVARLNVSLHYMRELDRAFRCRTGSGGAVLDLQACLDQDEDNLTRRDEAEDSVLTPGFVASAEARFWDNRLVAILGAEGYFDFVSSEARRAMPEGWSMEKRDRGNFSDGSTYRSVGTFVRAELDAWRADDSVVAVSGGARMTTFNAFAEDVPGVGDVTYAHAGFVGSAGINFRQGSLLNLYADFSQGFRAPNLQETTAMGDTGATFEIPNGDLEPVKSNTFEVGYKLNTGFVHIYQSGFVTRMPNAIERETVPAEEWEGLGVQAADVGSQRVVRRFNSAEATYRGTELQVWTEPFHNLSARSNFAWLEGEVENSAGETQPARRVPPFSGLAALRYESERLRFYVETYVKWASRQHQLNEGDLADLRICEDPANPGQLLADCEGTAGWATYNARAGFRPLEQLGFNLSVENLTDVRYKYHGSGILAPGLNVILEVSGSY